MWDGFIVQRIDVLRLRADISPRPLLHLQRLPLVCRINILSRERVTTSLRHSEKRQRRAAAEKGGK